MRSECRLGRGRRRPRWHSWQSEPPTFWSTGKSPLGSYLCTDQRDRRAMANKFWQLWILAEPQREHVPVPRDHDGLPPAVFERLLSDDEVAGRNVIPAFRKTGSHRG